MEYNLHELLNDDIDVASFRITGMCFNDNEFKYNRPLAKLIKT